VSPMCRIAVCFKSCMRLAIAMQLHVYSRELDLYRTATTTGTWCPHNDVRHMRMHARPWCPSTCVEIKSSDLNPRAASQRAMPVQQLVDGREPTPDLVPLQCECVIIFSQPGRAAQRHAKLDGSSRGTMQVYAITNRGLRRLST
jgi:hypothetical protein